MKLIVQIYVESKNTCPFGNKNTFPKHKNYGKF